MKTVLSILAQTLKDTEESELAYIQQGNREQADLRSSAAAEIRGAIAVLSAVERGPVWPVPQE
mgnify:CR=1 FL=1